MLLNLRHWSFWSLSQRIIREEDWNLNGKKPDGKDFRLDLAVGQTKQLPDGSGSITFDGVDRWVKLQVSDKPGKELALGGVLLAITGLLGSLFIRPRRAWVRVRSEGGRTLVELAGLDRSSGGDLGDELDELEALMQQQAPAQKEKP